MASYTPVFSTIYAGTLYGQWPAAAVFATLLPLFNSRGELDMSYQALAGMTGWPIDLLKQGIDQLSAPDPGSRSKDHEGRRLVPIDEDRDWGWISVNHRAYAEKARLKAKAEREVESGLNAQRMADRRDRQGPPEPPLTPSPTPTPTPTPTPEVKRLEEPSRAKRSTSTRLPEDFELTTERRKVCEEERLDPERTFAKFRDHWLAASGAKARKNDWDAAWRNWCRSEYSGNGQSAKPAKPVITWRPPDDVRQ